MHIHTYMHTYIRNDSKSLDELMEGGLCTMFLISGDIF